jgi:hypothetical protein
LTGVAALPYKGARKWLKSQEMRNFIAHLLAVVGTRTAGDG